MLLEVYGSWTEPYIPPTSQVDDYDSPLKNFNQSQSIHKKNRAISGVSAASSFNSDSITDKKNLVIHNEMMEA